MSHDQAVSRFPRFLCWLSPLGLAAVLAACGTAAPLTGSPAEPALDPSLPPSPAAGPRAEFVEGEVIAKFRDDVAPASLRAANVSLQRERELSGGELLLRFGGSGGVVTASKADTLAVVEALRARADVEYAQPNYLFYPDAADAGAGLEPDQLDPPVGPIGPINPPGDIILPLCPAPNDTYYNLQWHYKKISLPCTWSLLTQGQGSPVVAVLDTGKTNHPDLVGKFIGGYDFVSSAAAAKDGNGRDPDPTDKGDEDNGPLASSWHGTHVAGTIGAATNNAAGVAGVNRHARMLAVRVLAKGGGTSADIADGIRWSAGLFVAGAPLNLNRAKVINMSLGYPSPSNCSTHPVEQAAINAATTAGAIVVVSAGNNGDFASKYTFASCANTVAVAATQFDNTLAPYSNRGVAVDIAAPGGNVNVNQNGDAYPDGVLSTHLNGPGTLYNYTFQNGTSMAAPHISGVVSLMLAKTPGMTPAQVLAKLKATDTPLPGHSFGLVNAYKAVQP